MSEPREFETKNEGLTTEQLANAGDRPTPAAEPRAFDDRGERAPSSTGGASSEPIFAEDEASELRRTWQDIQGGFVDEPRRAVEDADHLVAKTMQRLAEMFAEERGRLERQWDRGDDVTTEDLRVGLQRYRAFFDRLLAV